MRPRRAIVALITIPWILFATAGSEAAPTQPAKRVRPSQAPSLIDNNDRLNVNNLDMVVTNYGSFAYDQVTGNAGLIYPTGSTTTAVFAAGLWVGARVQGEVRVTVADYESEYLPGIMVNGNPADDTPQFRVYRLERGNAGSPDYLNWPVWQGAPLGPDGKPRLLGDVMLWSVYNDANPGVHVEPAGSTAPLGLEVQQSTFAFNSTGPLGDAIFLEFQIRNQGGNTLEDAYVSLWSDVDLGGFTDDLAGCDTSLDLGYVYNATNADGQYGATPPATGFVLLRGPAPAPGAQETLGMTAFTRYINGTDPFSAIESYSYMQGLTAGGLPMHVGDDPNGPITTFAVTGDPVTGTGWVDTNPSDRRIMLTAGPFSMAPGETKEVVGAIVLGHGADRLASVEDLRNKVAGIHASLDEILTPTPWPSSVEVQVTFQPEIVNLAGRAPYVTATIEPQGFSAEQIVVGSIRLAGTIPAEPKSVILGDQDRDGASELLVRFSQAALHGLATGMHSLEVTGSTVDGTQFEGRDEIRVIDPPGGTGTLPVMLLSPTGASPVELATDATGEPHEVTVYDLHGRRITSWRAAPSPDGRLVWNGRSPSGGRVASGIYFLRVAAGSREGRLKVVIGR